jgi:hypothetical protein
MRAELAIETWQSHQCVLTNSAVLSIGTNMVQSFCICDSFKGLNSVKDDVMCFESQLLSVAVLIGHQLQ